MSAFDGAARQYATQLAERVPMKPGRREALDDVLFHNLKKAEAVLEPWFGIDLFTGFTASDADFVRQMFLRRHVYEHHGGQVTERYLEESGDASVKLRAPLESVMRSPIWSCMGRTRALPGGSGGGIPGSGGCTGLVF